MNKGQTKLLGEIWVHYILQESGTWMYYIGSESKTHTHIGNLTLDDVEGQQPEDESVKIHGLTLAQARLSSATYNAMHETLIGIDAGMENTIIS